MILDLTRDNIQQIVDKSLEQIVVLSFWTKQSPESLEVVQHLTAISQARADQFILAKVDCDSEMEIAQYFQVQGLPTVLVLSEGKPIDGFAGLQTQAEIETLLAKHIPAAWEVALTQAKELVASEQASEALPLLKLAYSENPTAEIALVYADAQLMLGDFSAASELLETIKLADQDSYYQSLKAKLSLAQEAADTPEIRELQQALLDKPDDGELVLELVKALHQAKRDEEALPMLFDQLKIDLNYMDGNGKTLFLEILTALGQSSSVAHQYRRQFYSLLY